MPKYIDLDKTVAASRIQPEIFKIRRKLKSSKHPEYVAVVKGSEIEMVCINAKAWEEYQNFKLAQARKRKTNELEDEEIGDGFSKVSAKDLLANEPPMTKKEYDYYMSL